MIADRNLPLVSVVVAGGCATLLAAGTDTGQAGTILAASFGIGTVLLALVVWRARCVADRYMRRWVETLNNSIRALGVDGEGRRDWLPGMPLEMQIDHALDGLTRLSESERINQSHATELAEERGREQEQFFARLSHELRSPLNAILGYTALLSEQAADKADTMLRADLDRIRDAGLRQLDLIDDLLTIAALKNEHSRAP
ncbi:MAG: hypothetical protein HC774_00400, partial [Sphingomonadales bacterium]|nr:hypothetical protein [Sphingomonadales bacterium]